MRLTNPEAAKAWPKLVLHEVKAQCAAHGLLLITVGDSMLRMLPPLVLTDEEADRGLKILGGVLAEVAKG